jgi:Spy/CpxP family protein refolding chaperone
MDGDYSMKRKVGLVVAAAVLMMLPLVPRLVRAQTGSHAGFQQCRMMGGHGGMMDGMSTLPMFLRAANLTPAQQAKVKTIMDANRATMHSQFEQMHTAREQMAEKLFSTGAVTAADLSAQTQQIAQAQQQLLQNELSVALQVRAILTPAQLQRVAQFHQQFESLIKQMHALIQANGGPGPGDGPEPGEGPSAGPGSDGPPPV